MAYLPRTPEDDLLICCARVSASETVRQRIDQVLRSPLDWQKVFDRSWWHRIRPLVYLHLRDHAAGVVPAAILQVLAQQVDELRLRNQRLVTMQDVVSALFDESHLSLLFFKGPTLAIDAYTDLSLRECGDLDMLIRPDEFPQVRQLLQDHGFECMWDDEKRERQLFACEFRRDGIELDVHWDLAPKWHNYHVDFERLWEGSIPVRHPHSFVRKLRPEDALEVLCMHGTRHWWERLRWICDIAELLNRGGIRDWDRVEKSATLSRCHRSVGLGLWLAVDLLEAELPAGVRRTLAQNPVIQRLGDQVGVWLANAEHAEERRKLPERFLFRMRLCDRGRDRFSQIANYFLTLPSRRANCNP